MKKRKETVCKRCASQPKLSMTYDKFYCEKCDAWIEYKKCTCGNCPYPHPESNKPSKCKPLKPTDAFCSVVNSRTKLKENS